MPEPPGRGATVPTRNVVVYPQNPDAALRVVGMSPLDAILQRYKVALLCEEELSRNDATKEPPKADELRRTQVTSVAATVDALAKLLP